MIPFTPSQTFQVFFAEVIAAAEAPVTPGTYAPGIPALADPHEAAFVERVLKPLIANINAMKASVTPTTPPSYTLGTAAAAAEAGDPAAQAAYEQLLWQQASSSAP